MKIDTKTCPEFFRKHEKLFCASVKMAQIEKGTNMNIL